MQDCSHHHKSGVLLEHICSDANKHLWVSSNHFSVWIRPAVDGDNSQFSRNVGDDGFRVVACCLPSAFLYGVDGGFRVDAALGVVLEHHEEDCAHPRRVANHFDRVRSLA
jgi:hypothetical protein